MQEIEDLNRHWKDERQETWKGDFRAFPYEGQCNTSGTETQMGAILTSKNTQEMSRPGMSRGTFERFLMMSKSLDVPH